MAAQKKRPEADLQPWLKTLQRGQPKQTFASLAKQDGGRTAAARDLTNLGSMHSNVRFGGPFNSRWGDVEKWAAGDRVRLGVE